MLDDVATELDVVELDDTLEEIVDDVAAFEVPLSIPSA